MKTLVGKVRWIAALNSISGLKEKTE